MSQRTLVKPTACLAGALAYAASSLLVVGVAPARAQEAAALAACEGQIATAEGIEEGIATGIDVAGDAASIGLLPVINAGWDALFDGINEGVYQEAGYLEGIDQNTCVTNTTLSTGPGVTAMPSLDIPLGLDVTPDDPATLPAEWDGAGETLSSPEANAADRENTLVKEAAETSLIGGKEPIEKLVQDDLDGSENQQGQAIAGIMADHAEMREIAILKDNIKEAGDIKDIAAIQAAIEAHEANIQTRADETNQEANLARSQDAINHDDQNQALWYGRMQAARAIGLTP